MKIIKKTLPLAASTLISLCLSSPGWAATDFQRIENKAHGLWIQTSHFDESTGEGQNIQAVPTNFTGDKTR